MTELFDEGSAFARHDRVDGAVLIVGVGTVGSSLAMQLARLGVRLRLVDKDILELPNIVRQQTGVEDLGRPKTDLAERIRQRMPWCEAEGIYADFTELAPSVRRWYIDEADVVVAATDEVAVQRLLNRECIAARKPIVLPGVWIDPRTGEAEAGEVLWVDPRRRRMPCYECVTTFRQEAGDAQAGRGAQADIDSIVLATAQVVRGLLQPRTEYARFLNEQRNLILVHGFMPATEEVGSVFSGRSILHVQVPFPPTPCPACGGRGPAVTANPPRTAPLERRPGPAARPTQRRPVRPRPEPRWEEPGRRLTIPLAPILLVLGVVGGFVLLVIATNKQYSNPPASVPRNAAWTAGRAPGIGPDNFSSPVDGAGLYPFILYETVHADTIRALDTDSGSQLWEFTSDSDSVATGDPASPGNQLVLGSDDQAFFAVDATTGLLQWRQPWPSGDQGLGPQISGGVAAIADQVTGQIYAYNATTGIPMWTSAQNSQLAYGHPEDFTIAAGTAFILTAHNLAAYDAHSGRLNWLAAVTDSDDPLQEAQQLGGVADGRIIVTGGSWVEAFSIASGHELWGDAVGGSDPLWPLVSQQIVIIHTPCSANDTNCQSGQDVGLDAMSGRQLWSEPAGTQWTNEVAPGEWLGSGMLLQWEPGSNAANNTITAIQPRTGKTLKTWNISGTMPQYVMADNNKLYIVNYDSSVLAVHR